MVDPTTANTSLAVPTRGSDVGTWDVPVNDNTTKIDSMFGGVTTVALSSFNVTLASSQGQTSIIRLTGTLTTSLLVFLPGLYKFWTLDNQLTNSPSSFAAFFTSTSGLFFLGCAPGVNDFFYDGSNIKYRNMQNVGAYWDYAGSAVPTWVTLSTVPPYLNCDGSAFSSATYPILTNVLGTTNLPDARGRNRYTLNQGTGRLTVAGAGINGDGVTNFGGTDGVVLSSANIPTITSTATVTITATTSNGLPFPLGANPGIGSVAVSGGGGFNVPYMTLGGGWSGITSLTGSANVSAVFSNAGQTNLKNATPGYVGGITMIRAG